MYMTQPAGTSPEEHPDNGITPVDLIDARTLARAQMRGVPVDEESVQRLLVSQALACRVLLPAEDPTLPDSEQQKYLIPGTRLFFNKPKAVDLGWNMATAAALFVTTGSSPAAAAATAFHQALRMMRLLTQEEADLTVVLGALSGGYAYDVPVSTQTIKKAFEEDRDKVQPLLDSMARRGLVTETAHGWHLIR